MYSIVTATIILGLIHALIPNHWLPLVAIAKTEKWSSLDVLWVTLISAFAHIISTVALGMALGLMGMNLPLQYEGYLRLAAAFFMVVFGIIYLMTDRLHRHSLPIDELHSNRPKIKWILLFVATMFLSPCLEVETLFLAASPYGIDSLLNLAGVYALVSIMGMLIMIGLTFTGASLIRVEFIQKNGKGITGIVLIIVGITSYFIH